MPTLGLLRLRLWWERAFWVLPLLGVLAAWWLILSLRGLDETLFVLIGSERLISTAAALALLSAIGAGMVTFTGLVFSVVLLIVQYGSSQYSPRTVAYFLRSRSTQAVLAVFVCTIFFSMLSLIEVGSIGRADFVPVATLSVASMLLLASLVAFLALLHGVGTRIRVDTVVSDIGRRCRRLLRRTFPRDPGSWERPPETNAEHVATRVVSFVGRPGQVVAVDVARLTRLAARHGAHIVMARRTGDAVVAGSPVASVVGAPGLSGRAVSRCLLVDQERSLRLDPLYGLRILTDISLRALSPGINDPTTAVRSLDEVESVLRTAAEGPLGPFRVVRGSGSVVVARASWGDVVDLGFAEVLITGQDQPQVTRRLSVMLDEMLADLPEELHPPLLSYRSQLVSVVTRSHPDDAAARLTGDHQGIGGSP